MTPVPRKLVLSLDLDNLWAYQMIHGDSGWQDRASYLDRVVPPVLDLLAERGLTITFFIVGLDAAEPRHRDLLRAIAEAGHEIGNHSHRHEPWLHRYALADLRREFHGSHEAITEATGMAPTGFRGPGYSVTDEVVSELSRLGYAYDASTLPTFIGPLARSYYFRTTELSEQQRSERAALYGHLRDGFLRQKPYRWASPGGSLLEIPVTTCPGLKTPFHPSYLLFLDGRSPGLARSYLRAALWACDRLDLVPSLLFHPLDFLGGDEVPELAFFPGMGMTGPEKRERATHYLDLMIEGRDVVGVGAYARELSAVGGAVPSP